MIDSSFKVEFEIALLNGHIYYVPKHAAHRPACRQIMRGQYHEVKTHRLIKSIFQANSGDLVHAGTFFGDMLPSFSSSVGSAGTVYAFEPVLESYVLAKQCVYSNRLSNVILMNSGLSNCFKTARIKTQDAQSGECLGGGSTIHTLGDQLISTSTIDSLSIQNLLCLHLDIEGHELFALQGARETLQKCKPLILIEDNSRNCASYLSNLNYSHIGKIPGLEVWCSDGDPRFGDVLLGI